MLRYFKNYLKNHFTRKAENCVKASLGRYALLKIRNKLVIFLVVNVYFVLWSWRGNSNEPQNVKSKSVIPLRKIFHLLWSEHIVIFVLLLLFFFLPFIVPTILNKHVNCLLWVFLTWRGKGYIEKKIFFKNRTFLNHKTFNFFGSILRLVKLNFVQIMISRGRGGPQGRGGLIFTEEYIEKNLWKSS